MGEVLSTQEQVIVVIGASAGGIDALERLAATLPANFPAPVVIAQHLDPSHESRLDAILKQRTALRVVALDDKAALAPGTLYVVPAPGKTLKSPTRRSGLLRAEKKSEPGLFPR